jgi:uncharacterized protein YceH (UPF0502 family)
VLLLRGPQTPGELRGRTERMHPFEALDDVISTLDKMSQHDPALVVALPRQPGSREIRYAHLLSGEPHVSQLVPVEPGRSAERGSELDQERIARLEAEVAELREQFLELMRQIATGDGSR